MKTADELGISLPEYRGLHVVRDMLRRHAAESKPLRLRDMLYGKAYDNSHTIDGHGLFNMAMVMAVRNDDVFNDADRRTYNCGTIGCIGGWNYLIMNNAFDPETHVGAVDVSYHDGDAAFRYVNAIGDGPDTPLKQLYYPVDVYGPDWGKITPTQAADAIDNFLTKGAPGWKEVLGDSVQYMSDIAAAVDEEI